ncbi:MAG: hypothetical protein AAFY59_06930 [Pseudomonadota bacterium]
MPVMGRGTCALALAGLLLAGGATAQTKVQPEDEKEEARKTGPVKVQSWDAKNCPAERHRNTPRCVAYFETLASGS